MGRLFSSSVGATLLCCGAPALAADAVADGAASAAEQPEIVVTGERPEYGVRTTSTATKTRTDIRNIPQALTVISERQIADQTLRSVADLLMFVPGATPGTGEGNRDQMTLRGNNTTADFFIDGVRDDAQVFRDFYNVDRVEVLKGPNAMIFGRGGGGGIVNRVLKRSSLNSYRNMLGSGDGFGGFRVSGDFDQPLATGVGLRLNAVYEDGDSFRRHVDLKRYGINPTAGILIGPDTRADISFEHLHDRRTADRGVPADGDEPIEGFDKTFFGDPGRSFARANVDFATLAVEHRLSEGLTLRNRTQLASYDKFYQNIYARGFNAASGLVSLDAYNNRNDRRNLFSQTDLVWENRLAGIDQTVLLGFELGRQKSRNHRRTGTIAGGNTTPISDPTVDREVTFASVPNDANNRTRATVAAIYVQDQIRPASWLEIVAGVRFDSFKLRVEDLRANGGEFGRRDSLWSPRLGVVLKPRDNLSLYGSFSRSYLPQSGDQFSGLTSTTEELKPERFDNYELGAKWEPVHGLLATAAIYQLDRANTQARDQNDRIVLTGGQRTRGVELGLERSITSRWQISAGYAWQKAEVTRPTNGCPSGECKVPLVPRHSFSLWNRYDVTGQLGLGLGLIARSRSFASISNHVKLPGYARLDGALFYKLPHGIETQVNFENLLGTDYFPTAHNDNNIEPGRPRTVRVSLGYSF
ncbi:MAG: TonB-dependent receptor [Sphingomicrobium sp.]